MFAENIYKKQLLFIVYNFYFYKNVLLSLEISHQNSENVAELKLSCKCFKKCFMIAFSVLCNITVKKLFDFIFRQKSKLNPNAKEFKPSAVVSL